MVQSIKTLYFPVQSQDGCIFWEHSKDGLFTVKSAYLNSQKFLGGNNVGSNCGVRCGVYVYFQNFSFLFGKLFIELLRLRMRLLGVELLFS